jgi:SAM-dependent methyltransferase
MSMKREGVDDFGGHMLARLSGAPRFNAWMADRIRPFCGEHVLEIGAGIGNVTRVLLPGRRYIATDINPRYLDVLAGQGHGRPSFGVQYCDVTDPASFPAVDGGFDTVVCLNVLEHVEDDLRALGNIRRALAPGGRAIVLVPQGRWNFGTLDAAVDHRRRYTKRRLRSLAAAAGFEIEDQLSFNRAGTAAWFLNGRLLRRRRVGRVQVRLLDVLTPLLRRVDAWLPLPALSLIAVLKPAADE